MDDYSGSFQFRTQWAHHGQTTSKQRCSNAINVDITLFRRHLTTMCLLGIVLFSNSSKVNRMCFFKHLFIECTRRSKNPSCHDALARLNCHEMLCSTANDWTSALIKFLAVGTQNCWRKQFNVSRTPLCATDKLHCWTTNFLIGETTVSNIRVVRHDRLGYATLTS